MTYQEILSFWFSELKPSQWFGGRGQVDDLIRSRFEALIDSVYHGEHQDWLSSCQGKLATVIVLDQFPRNVYRGSARSFAYDDRALAVSLEGIGLGEDLELGLHERAFFYLPLEHSERLEIQDRALERYASLVFSIKPADKKNEARDYLDYAWRHYAIIRRFGRYPHRNQILGRLSTAEEIEFLKAPGSSF